MGKAYKRQNVGRYVIEALRALGGTASRQAIREQMIDDEGNSLTYEDIFAPVTSKNGRQYVPFLFDFNFSLTELRELGYVEPFSRGGEIVLTEKGRAADLSCYPTADETVKLKAFWERHRTEGHAKKEAPAGSYDKGLSCAVDASVSAEEAEPTEDDPEQWKIDILDCIKGFSPKKFESFSRLLFSKMGVKFDAEKGVKMSGDHGMDGFGYFVSDEFRTSKVVVQCKRFTENAVGEPSINEFMGVMMAESADYGIFVTTSHFTKAAQRKAVQGSCTVTLIDGQKLVELIEEYKLHIKPVITYELDDYYYQQD